MLKFVYSFFLGILLAVFVGMGVATFYPEPKAPVYPPALSQPEKMPDGSAEQLKLQNDYQQKYDAYNKKQQSYSRDVSMIALGAAVVLVAFGLALESRVSVIADGLLLGGTFTLIYSIGRSFAGQNPKYSFMVTTAGLAITIVVGYLKFIKPPSSVRAGKRKKK